LARSARLLFVVAIIGLLAALARTITNAQGVFASTSGGGDANLLSDFALPPTAGGSAFIPADLGLPTRRARRRTSSRLPAAGRL
jgi:hypothetical protein